MRTIKTASIYIDIVVCLLMAWMIYVMFPFGRWIDQATLSTMLLFGFCYLTYVVNRTVTVPCYFKGGRGPLLSALILTGFTLLMAALTRYREGWPFYQLEDVRNMTLGQYRAWLFFLVVQLASISVGIFAEMNRLRITYQQSAGERDSQPQTISIKSDRKTLLIMLSDILYIESKDNYVYLTLTDGRQLKTQGTLVSLGTQLPPDEFIRIHKSFIISRSHVRSFNSRQVCVGETTLPIGRVYADGVRMKLQG